MFLQRIYDKAANRLGHAQFLQPLKFCLRMYFMFDGTINEQLTNTPIGSPISGLIAEVFLQRLESLTFRRHRPKFWAPYTDGIFDVIDLDQLLSAKERFPTVCPDIRCSMEEGENNQLAFLDVLLEKMNIYQERETFNGTMIVPTEHTTKFFGTSKIIYGYLRSIKGTQELSPALRSADEKVETDDQIKASLLSKFFHSVFTR
nr:unnamed protein product [Spirometra erinaceieuropaei]